MRLSQEYCEHEVDEPTRRWTYLPIAEQGWGGESDGNVTIDESCLGIHEMLS